MRKLLYIPTIHSQGEASPGVANLFSLFSEKDRKELENRLEKQWGLIERGVNGMTLDFNKTRIFSEGVDRALPNPTRPLTQEGKREARLFLESFLKDQVLESPQLRLLLPFWLEGASLEVTEHPELHKKAEKSLSEFISILLEGDLDEALDESNMREMEQSLRRLDEANVRRDEFVARTINETLQDGETGILIIGYIHDVLGKLDKDIEVDFIDPELEETVRELSSESPSMQEVFLRTIGEGYKSSQGLERK